MACMVKRTARDNHLMICSHNIYIGTCLLAIAGEAQLATGRMKTNPDPAAPKSAIHSLKL
jgi:hypothetical protein